MFHKFSWTIRIACECTIPWINASSNLKNLATLPSRPAQKCRRKKRFSGTRDGSSKQYMVPLWGIKKETPSGAQVQDGRAPKRRGLSWLPKTPCSLLYSRRYLSAIVLPEMVFHLNRVELVHEASGVVISLNAFDALAGWRHEDLPPLQVRVAEVRERQPQLATQEADPGLRWAFVATPEPRSGTGQRQRAPPPTHPPRDGNCLNLAGGT